MSNSATKSESGHIVASREDWLAARLALLDQEKEYTRRGDELARQRQALPWVRIDKQYRFETDERKASLADLFKGRFQLVVYHFMFGPGYTAGCPACSATADSFNGVLPHLEARDTTMICISRAPLQLSWAATPGQGYSILSTTNLSSAFQTVTSFVASNAVVQWPIPTPATGASFYRVSLSP